MTKDYPMLTPYQFASNRPIDGIDLDGLEVLLVNRENDPTIYNGAQSLTDKSAIHIVAHGWPGGIANDINNTKIRTSQQFLTILKKSDQFEAQSKSGEVCVVLHSCRTGRPIKNIDGSTTPSFAQNVSKELNYKVIAPDERDFFSSSGESGPFKVKYTDLENSNYKPGIPNEKHGQNTGERGNWLVYEQGVLTSVYSGAWSPKGNPGFLDNLLYRKNLTYSVNSKSLNLRVGAGTSFETNGTPLSEGSVLTPTGNVNKGWMEVNTPDGRSGWVNSQFTTPQY